ncbi:unnamed protein product [Toxocara canis]|uniref:Col_cuticle_N domain-containing protein n=1 Tax=Toxocara canis TaxID=6265 RepID=A0A183U8R5_TOXCA|nr:unnamed protein product [Toxocara canis]
MNARLCLLGASVCCASVLVVSLLVAISLIRDINGIYASAMLDMEEFRTFANDAWREMAVITHAPLIGLPNSTSQIAYVGSIFGIRRQKREAICDCAPQPNNCPPGPEGSVGK